MAHRQLTKISSITLVLAMDYKKPIKQTPLKILLLEESLRIKEMPSFKPQQISRDWAGNETQQRIEFSLLLDPESLWFQVRVDYSGSSPFFNPNHHRGEFVEGLWQMDVAEFFLCDPESGNYQEFNLAPSGAWWSQFFSEYRQIAQEKFNPPTVEIHHSTIDSSCWQALLSVSRSSLKVDLAKTSLLRAQVCFILGDPQQFFAWGSDPGCEPDFHKSSLYSNFDILRPACVS